MAFLESNGHTNSKGLKDNYKSKDCNCNYKSRVTPNMSHTSLLCPQRVLFNHKQNNFKEN